MNILTRVCLLFLGVISTSALQSQPVTNVLSKPTGAIQVTPKPRSLAEDGARETRSNNVDQTGMTIHSNDPIYRLLTPEELDYLELKGIDSTPYKGKAVPVYSAEQVAASQLLIIQAQQTNSPSKVADLKHAYIWLNTFMGMTNAALVAHVRSMKKEALKFQLGDKDYDYSGHYTVMLENPRAHKTLGFSWGFSTTAKMVILDNVGGKKFPLMDAVIWEKSGGFINAVAQGKEWIHSGSYTIQNQ